MEHRQRVREELREGDKENLHTTTAPHALIKSGNASAYITQLRDLLLFLLLLETETESKYSTNKRYLVNRRHQLQYFTGNISFYSPTNYYRTSWKHQHNLLLQENMALSAQPSITGKDGIISTTF